MRNAFVSADKYDQIMDQIPLTHRMERTEFMQYGSKFYRIEKGNRSTEISPDVFLVFRRSLNPDTDISVQYVADGFTYTAFFKTIAPELRSILEARLKRLGVYVT